MSEERLQKVLARAGVAARRKAEELISAGRVRVDGQVVTTLGTKVNPRKQRIELDGKILRPERLCYGIFHKPRGMVTTLRDPEGRPTAMDVLREVGVRVVPVGRLDFNTSGALLFTNDGDFAQALSHASGNVPKVYAAKVQKRLEEEDLSVWSQQIEIDGKLTRPAAVRILRREGDKTWLEVTLKEGKNRQVRRLGDHAGTPVVRLARLSQAGIETTGLRPGQWRLLTSDELKGLRERYGVPEKIRGVATADRPASPAPKTRGQAGGAKSSSAKSAPRGRSGAGPSRVLQKAGKATRSRGASSEDQGNSRGASSAGRNAPRGASSTERSTSRGASSAGRKAPRGGSSTERSTSRGASSAGRNASRGASAPRQSGHGSASSHRSKKRR